MKKVVIIGSGFAGLSAASFMAKAGWDVTVLEKHSSAGGRARQLKEAGFTFDMGPSWYWMPDVFERFFNCFGRKVSDFYALERLDPSYRVYWTDEQMDIPADYNNLRNLFEKTSSGSAAQLDKFMEEAAFKYDVGINRLVHKPGQSLTEFADWDFVKGIFKLDVFTSIRKHIRRHFKDPKLQQLLEFPVLFLGALPQHTPALYSLMNYADIKLGTWYPQGGMHRIVEGMVAVAKDLGVKLIFNQDVQSVKISGKKISAVEATSIGAQGATNNIYEADVVIGGADYHFIETELLPVEFRSYSANYWDKRVLAPSSLLFYVGIDKKIPGLQHHSLFFDVDFEKHGAEIYTDPAWPVNPLFYVSATSVTDQSVAPIGCENLFFLVPVAAGLTGDTEELREQYFLQIVDRFEKRIGQSIRDNIVYRRSYAISDFKKDYNSFKGNAYGLANTLLQTAVLKPSIRSKKLTNLFYTGQLTVPGPGVPPSLVSGEVVAKEVNRYFG
ncbi:MAG: phytoene desaturase family protein [Bacteroidota bacterium]